MSKIRNILILSLALLWFFVSCAGSDNLVYQNDEYGFKITFSEDWQDFKVYEQTTEWGYGITAPTFYIALPTNDEKWYSMVEEGYASIFAITAFTEKDWEELKSHDEPFMDVEIGSNNFYVFTSGHGQACPEDLYDMFSNDEYEVEIYDVK